MVCLVFLRGSRALLVPSDEGTEHGDGELGVRDGEVDINVDMGVEGNVGVAVDVDVECSE